MSTFEEEDKARIERARAEAQERKEWTRHYIELWNKGIDPLTGESLDPSLKLLIDKMLEHNRNRRMQPYDVERGVINVRVRTHGRNRKVRRG